MTNNKLTDEKIKIRINAIEERHSASRDFWDGDYEYPEDIELLALLELQELRRNYLALRGEIEDVRSQLYEAENQANEYASELQERRKADCAEPVAWLHTDNGIGIPAITRSRNVANSWLSKGWKIQPLYTVATQSTPLVKGGDDAL